MSGPPLIELKHVHKCFGDFVAVVDLDLVVSEGEIVALVGRTGAGKSTVMNLIMGTIQADQGTVKVAGADPYTAFASLKGKLAVSFQTDRLLPWRTTVENVELGLLLMGRKAAEARRLAFEWLDRVKLQGAASKYPHELSGGMRQRVSLARALAVDPELVLLDESFSQLDHVTSAALRRDFSQVVRQYGKTCVFVTHRIDDAIEMADRIVVLAPGARMALEIEVSQAQREDADETARLHAVIAQTMGGEEQ